MSRLVALAAAAFFLAFPLRAALIDARVPLVFKLGFALLLVVGSTRPGWRAYILIAGVPLVPWLPFEHRHLPHGIVHLLVLSQALPWLVESVFRRRSARPSDMTSAWWAVLVLVAACSVVVDYVAYATTFASRPAFLMELTSHLSRYVFERPSMDFQNMLVAVSTLADGALAFALVKHASATTERLACTAAGTAIVVSLAGMWQAFTGIGLRRAWRDYDPFITRINATFSDPNALAAFLAVMVPLTLALAGGARDSRRRGVWMAGAAVCLVTLLTTAGRIGSGAALVGVGVLAIGAWRLDLDLADPSRFVRTHFRALVRLATVVIVCAVLLLAALGTALDARHESQRSYVDTWLYTLNLRRPLNETAKGRIAIWKTAIAMIEDRPVFGVGAGRIYRVFQNYSQSVPDAPKGVALSAHNTFLNIGAELGLVGLAAWLGLLASVAWAGARQLRSSARESEAADTWLRLGLLAGFSALVVTMTTGDRTILREDAVLMGIVSALIVRGGSTRDETASEVRQRRWPWVPLCLGALVVATLPLRLQAARQDVRLDRVMIGLYAEEREQDGTRFRWSSERAIFHVPASASALTLRVRSLAPFPQDVRVLVDGAPITHLRLTDHNWQAARALLPRQRSSHYHRVEVLAEPIWSGPADPRPLGVMLSWDWK
jgi:O-antigen ligase